MKSIFKYASGLALAGMLSLTLAPAANAQRGFHGGGGIRISGRSGAGFGLAGGLNHTGLNFGVRSGIKIGHTKNKKKPTNGFRFGLLPFGYYPFYWGADLYY